MIRRVILALALLFMDAVAAAQPPSPCRTHPELVGPCRTVRGRLSAWNGTPSLRIWVVGTSRILGVSESRMSGRDLLPANVQAALGDRAFGVQLFGNFQICPFTRQRPGWMQMVCVARATRLFAVRR